VDIDDVVWLIDYIFTGGPVPLPHPIECDNGAYLTKAYVGICEIFASFDSPKIPASLSVKSDIIPQAIQLELTGVNPDNVIVLESLVDGLEIFRGHVDGVFRIGLFDLEGQVMIPSDGREILRISCDSDIEMRLSDAIVIAQGGGRLATEINPVNREAELPTSFELAQNYPNPFNPTTEINFSLQHGADVSLEIYNIMGQRVATLVDEYRESGAHSVTWDGRDTDGKPASSGIYFYRLRSGSFNETKKMMLLK
jgi:hypothetical protein